jgi:hypothetical protein
LTGWREGGARETNSGRDSARPTQKMARTKDDDEEDSEMTLDGYETPG